MLSAILLSTGSVFLLGRAVFGKKKRGKSTTMEKREQLGSRLGFIMISAGCAIGCGNVWKFPWMCGQNGGGGFMLIYLICLLILGLPVMTMEFSVGRAARTSPIYMYQKLEKPGHKWGIFGIVSLIGNITLMALADLLLCEIFNRAKSVLRLYTDDSESVRQRVLSARHGHRRFSDSEL